jgi:tetratricopeptide (TPR) repeat protein
MQKWSVLLLFFIGSFSVDAQIKCAEYSAAYGKSIALFDSMEYSQAVKSFTKIINETSLAKCFNKSYYYRGSSYFYLGKTDSAITDFEIYTKLEPEDELGLRKMGALYYYIGNNDLALIYYKAALDLAPEDVYTLYNMGEAYFQSGNLESADKMYRKAFKLDTTHYESLVGIGKVQAESDLFDLALSNLDRAIKMNPGQYQAFFWKGIVYMRAPHMGKAEDKFDAAQKRDSTDANIYINRAITHSFTFNFDKA